MKILLLGATGRTGRHIIAEALRRGHEISAIVRDPEKLKDFNIEITQGTPYDYDTVEKAITGCNAVINTLNVSRKTDNPWSSLTAPKDLISESASNAIKAMGKSGIKRFIALGTVIKDFLHPDIVLIGESDKSAGDKTEEIYTAVCENSPYIAHMSIIGAEITKIALNSYVTMKISFANMITNICENVPGADIDTITQTLGADKRIAPYYLKGGVAFGGPCFPRDNQAFLAFAQRYGCDVPLVKATDEVNRLQIERLVNRVQTYVTDNINKTVSILGLSYKPGTPVIEESAGVKIIVELLKRDDIKIIVYDSLAMDNAKLAFGDRISYASSVQDCLAQAPFCVITTQEDEFKRIDASYIAHDPTTIIDCWRILDPTKLGKKVNYVALGRVA